jgi:hypothetical protein
VASDRTKCHAKWLATEHSNLFSCFSCYSSILYIQPLSQCLVAAALGGQFVLVAYAVLAICGYRLWRFVRDNYTGPNERKSLDVNQQLTLTLTIQV